MEHCSGRIINEWLCQILQGGTVRLLVLLLLHIKHINNRKGEVSRSSFKRNLIVIYCQNFPINMSSGERLWITTKTKLKRKNGLAGRGIIAVTIVRPHCI